MFKGLVDVTAEHKLPAKFFHRLANDHPHRRLANPLHRSPQTVDNPAGGIRVEKFPR